MLSPGADVNRVTFQVFLAVPVPHRILISAASAARSADISNGDNERSQGRIKVEQNNGSCMHPFRGVDRLWFVTIHA